MSSVLENAPKFDVSNLTDRLPFGQFDVTVTTGAHRGVSHQLRASTIAIGTDPANDIVLFGDDLAARHFGITITDRLFGKAKIHALEGSVELETGELIERGQSHSVRLPVTVEANGVCLSISPSLELDRFWTNTAGMVLLFAAVIIGGQILSNLPGPSTWGHSTSAMVEGIRSTVSETVKQPGNHISLMKERVDAAGLAEIVFLDQTSSGAIVASGSIGDEEAARWRQVLQWNDAQRGAPLLVNNVKKNAQPTSMPTVRSIWMGNDPYVILENGQTAREGDTLNGGWLVEKITDSSVILNRSGRRVSITY